MRALVLILALAGCGTVQGAVCPPIPVKVIVVKPLITSASSPMPLKPEAKPLEWPDHYEDNDTHSRLQRIENKTDNLLAHTKDKK